MLSARSVSVSISRKHGACRKKSIRLLAPIEELPDELLAEIASNVSLRHPVGGYVVEATNLASFSTVSRVMRAAALPVLFNEVPISSERLLRAFVNVPPCLLRFVR